jgi:glycosyltransferase involved in cell wall biosynthesis
VRIALVSEGTYPFAMGGVSVWCDQLIRGLTQHEWEVVALTVNGAERAVWPAPDNLTAVRTIPLWGPHATLRRRKPGDAFMTPYADLVASLLKPVATDTDRASADRIRFLNGLKGLHDIAQREDVAAAMTSGVALSLLMDEWNALYGDGLSLADALDVALLLEHMLRPLFAEPVEADIVHASMNGLSMLVAMAAKWRYGSPVIMSEHGIYLRERYLAYLHQDAPHAVKVLVLSFFRLLAGAGYLVADALAPHSAYNRRWQLQNGADARTMWTMYNGVSPDLFPAAQGEPEVPTIVFMGRIDPLKDLHNLVWAFSLVVAEMPAARLRIFGGTPDENRTYRDSCVKLIEDLALTSSITLEGPVGSPVDAYHAGSIVVLSSISEGFPYSVVEAMACQRTVVCTDVGGVKEAVGRTGLVVPPRNSPALAHACLRLLRDDALRRSLAVDARLRIMEYFTLDHSLMAYSRLYDNLSGDSPETAPASTPLDAVGWDQLDDTLAHVPQTGER